MELRTKTAWQKGPHKSLLVSGLVIARAYLRQYPLRLAFAVFMYLLSGLLDGIGLISLMPMLDILINEGGTPNQITEYYIAAFDAIGVPMTLWTIVFVMIATTSVKSLLMYFAETYVGFMIAGVNGDLRMRLIRALMLARWPFFTREPMGKLTNFIINETNQASKSALALVDMTSMGIQTLVYLASAVLVSWQLTVAGVLAGLVISYLLSYFIRLSRRTGAELTALRHSYMTRIIEWLHAVKSLKAMALDDRVNPFLEKDTKSLVEVDRRLITATQGLAQAQEPLTAIFIGMGAIVAIEVLDVPTTSLLVMAVIFARTVGRINGIQKAFRKLAGTEAAYYAVTDGLRTIQEQAEQDVRHDLGGSKLSVPPIAEGIRFERVTFAHEDRPVIRDLSLTFEAGRFTVIVGPSGVGKSTVIDLLAGLLIPDSGRILVDGLDLSSFARRDWRQTLGYVPQETTLLHATVAENLTLGDPAVSEETMIEALKMAGAWEFVADMPGGLHAIVGERGMKISGGQRQRLAIARALVRRPKLLLLDEATSALDQQSEQALCDTLKTLAPEITIVAISHRPALERVADVIYHMRDGEVFRVDEQSASDVRAPIQASQTFSSPT